MEREYRMSKVLRFRIMAWWRMRRTKEYAYYNDDRNFPPQGKDAIFQPDWMEKDFHKWARECFLCIHKPFYHVKYVRRVNRNWKRLHAELGKEKFIDFVGWLDSLLDSL